jgi:primase-polymerase (primpol)-like protein
MDHGPIHTLPAPAESLEPAIGCHPDAVPAELRQRDQWVLWRYMLRDGKPTKVPISAKTLQEASSTDPQTWSSFAEVVHALGEGSAFAGIGYTFSADDPYTGIDLDECLADGQLVPAAQQIVDAFSTYTEVSPSGTGVKMIIRGAKPDGARCKSKAIDGFKETEVYDRARYFTITGQRWASTPEGISERQAELDELCRRLWPPQETPSPRGTSPSEPVVADDQDLLDRMFNSKNGAAIRALWNGDTSAYDGDDSAADMALCNHLAFWTRCDKDRMDRLFRGSGLFRGKWERDDYRNWTLDLAIGDCRETYSAGGGGGNGRHRGHDQLQRERHERGGGRADIHIDVDEYRVISETIVALATDPDLYQRGNVLVRVLRNVPSTDGVVRADGSATIVQMPTANLRERMTRCANFTRNGPQDSIVPTHPSLWLVAGVDARG